jgi:hypothetical protein
VDAGGSKYDLLFYSPSISSGVSFIRERFVACGVPGQLQFTPGVGLQQLFRVRRLKDGACTFCPDTAPA